MLSATSCASWHLLAQLNHSELWLFVFGKSIRIEAWLIQDAIYLL